VWLNRILQAGAVAALIGHRGTVISRHAVGTKDYSNWYPIVLALSAVPSAWLGAYISMSDPRHVDSFDTAFPLRTSPGPVSRT
jgi:hypothetical protein